MADRDIKNDQLATSELIAAETQQLVETVRENQRELDARIAETSELIDRTTSLVQNAETVEQSFDEQRPDDS